MITICQVGPEAACDLAKLHAQAFDRAWPQEAMQALLGQPGMLCLAGRMAAGRPICGFVLARVAADEAEIITFAVHPQDRRQGVARALIAELGQILHKQSIVSLFLEVAEDNTAARGLYEACGFSLTGRRKAYYATRERRVDALILRCETRECRDRRDRLENADHEQ